MATPARNITVDDLIDAGEPFGVAAPRDVLAEVGEVVQEWESFAERAGVSDEGVAMVRERLDAVWDESQMSTRYRAATPKRGPMVARYARGGTTHPHR